jgi:hypothetical protein
VLDMQYLPDYKDLVARRYETYVNQHNYNTELYEPPLIMFGAEAVERWFTEKEVEEMVKFVKKMEKGVVI